MNQNLTANEIAVILSIGFNHFRSNHDDLTEPVWTDSINDSSRPSGLKGHDLSGVVSSLNKKGLAASWRDGRDSVICLTEDGIEAFNANR